MGYRIFPFFLLSLLAWGEGAPKAPLSLDRLLHSVTAESFVDRLEAFSAAFIGTPFLAMPLGEGPRGKYDQGPLYRFDAFDCTTLVETVVALSLSHEAKQFPEWMRRIRYRNSLPVIRGDIFIVRVRTKGICCRLTAIAISKLCRSAGPCRVVE